MNILICCDSFKGSLDASEACAALAIGFSESSNENQVVQCPLADGGEGTAEILTRHFTGTWHETITEDPLGRSISAGYGISEDGKKAFID